MTNKYNVCTIQIWHITEGNKTTIKNPIRTDSIHKFWKYWVHDQCKLFLAPFNPTLYISSLVHVDTCIFQLFLNSRLQMGHQHFLWQAIIHFNWWQINDFIMVVWFYLPKGIVLLAGLHAGRNSMSSVDPYLRLLSFLFWSSYKKNVFQRFL